MPDADTALEAEHRGRQLAMVGGALGLFALGALAAALVLEAPPRAEPKAETPPATGAAPQGAAR